MVVEKRYSLDVEGVLSHRYDNGADYWTTPDKRLLKGSPFSTLESAMYLLELGVKPSDPLMVEIAALIFNTWKEDGRFKLNPQGSIYPCQTANAANSLCHMGFANDMPVQNWSRFHVFS